MMRPEYDYTPMPGLPEATPPSLRDWLLEQIAVTEKSARAFTSWGSSGSRVRGGEQRARVAAFRTVLAELDRREGRS